MSTATVTHAPCPEYLSGLNPEQLSAVLHGSGAVAPALLTIAGAGSGKTGMLAHRVAHLLVQGADPRRILLMTFSRRAAAEMTRRVERIVGKALGEKPSAFAGALEWAGTFHAIGARLLRDHAEAIGLDEAFTVMDREDAAALMDLVRHDLGYSNTESRFPSKATCIAIYSRVVNSRQTLDEVLAVHFPKQAQWAAELKQLFRGYIEAKQKTDVLDYEVVSRTWWKLSGGVISGFP
jgi:DNA helicase II / ATP-dependent DNA helicase PcrA